MKLIQVCEYAKLTMKQESSDSLNQAKISESTYHFLVKLIEDKRLNGSIYRDHIKLGSQVGYIETPDIAIEVLPKISTRLEDQAIGQLRTILQKMVSVLLQAPFKEISSAHLVRNNLPLHEWIYQQFLTELTILFRKGLKRDYERISRRETFMRGQLDVTRVMRARAGQAHQFPINYDEFNFNRLENRLIKTALGYLFRQTKSADNWRVANEMKQRLSSLEDLPNAYLHLPRWQKSKLMQSYQNILPWCELILEKMNPNFQQGGHKGIALLFPMEKLFEAYVGSYLKNSVKNWEVCLQEQSYALVKHQEKELFRLKPDIVLKAKRDSKVTIIADTKWKLLNEHQDNGSEKYGIQQADFYQMLGYGYRYQQHHQCDTLMLIYPYHDDFTKSLDHFEFENGKLHLWVIPFRLSSNEEDEGFITDHVLLQEMML